MDIVGFGIWEFEGLGSRGFVFVVIVFVLGFEVLTWIGFV